MKWKVLFKKKLLENGSSAATGWKLIGEVFYDVYIRALLKIRGKDVGGGQWLANSLNVSIKRFHMVGILLTNLNIINKLKKNLGRINKDRGYYNLCLLFLKKELKITLVNRLTSR